MINNAITRRTVFRTSAGLAVAAAVGNDRSWAADKSVTVGINLSLTGADAESAKRIENGALMAFDEANAKGGVNGYKIVVTPYDDGTATAGQYDPAQAATNARKMVSDKDVVAAIGPQMSGAGKAMTPILSQGDLAMITPSSTNPDITDPKFAAQYRPAGKAIYFRTVATDAYQGPYMANYYRRRAASEDRSTFWTTAAPTASGWRTRSRRRRRRRASRSSAVTGWTRKRPTTRPC